MNDPATYNSTIGTQSMTIVIPVPSGVITAENITKNNIAWRHLLLQKAGGITPIQLNATIPTGSKNITPVARVNPRTDARNSSIEKNGVAPIVVANGYKIRNVAGTRKK